MATMADFALKGRNRDSYLELVSAFPLASIKSDKHLSVGPESDGSTAGKEQAGPR